eukprot:TRINITY_DN21872_c0_g1_i1.p1 TRINITY_DN21872_c0_g1~~TRINITY_DN21872_c0_g1_i1.p1  ORF type:complete len:382 (+),score=133.98 TRINITY_DN21872_c0_g1_i1:239-1384(+)
MPLRKDPRTKLRILERVPSAFPELQHLNDFVMHWLGRVAVKWADGNANSFDKELQVMVISDVEVLLLKANSDKLQYVYNIAALDSVYENGKGDILLVPSDTNMPSCLFRPDDAAQSKQVLKILTSMYSFHEVKPLKVHQHALNCGSSLFASMNLLGPHITESRPSITYTTLGTVEELRKHLKRQGYVNDDATTQSSRSRYVGASAASEDLQAVVEALEEKLEVTEKQLARCKDALRDHIGDHNTELEQIKEQFLELTQYLNRVYAAFPNVRSSLGSPPIAMPGIDKPDFTAALLQQSHQDMQDENTRLKARIAQLEREKQESQHQASLQATLASFRWNEGATPKRHPANRVPAAEARRHYRPPVSGGMGPGGPTHIRNAGL